MRRRHSALAIALGAFITIALLALGAMIESPGILGHGLFGGADKVQRLSDPAAKAVASVPTPAVRHHAKARKVTVSARAVEKHAARHTAAAKPRVQAGADVGRSIGEPTSSRSVPATAPKAVAPAPAAAATPAPAPSTPATAKPAPVVAKSAKADIKVASAAVGSDGKVHVTLAVAQAAGTAPDAVLPSQLAVDMQLGSLSRAVAAAAGPMALDTALDIVPDPGDPSNARLRMRMQLASQDSSAPAAPADDPDGLSNVVTVRLNVPAPPPPRGGEPVPTPTPSDPAPSDPAPADATPVEVQLPITTADAPADPASQTVQLPVPPAADGSGTDAAAPAMPVDVSVTPVDAAPAADPTATPTAIPTPIDG